MFSPWLLPTLLTRIISSDSSLHPTDSHWDIRFEQQNEGLFFLYRRWRLPSVSEEWADPKWPRQRSTWLDHRSSSSTSGRFTETSCFDSRNNDDPVFVRESPSWLSLIITNDYQRWPDHWWHRVTIETTHFQGRRWDSMRLRLLLKRPERHLGVRLVQCILYGSPWALNGGVMMNPLRLEPEKGR